MNKSKFENLETLSDDEFQTLLDEYDYSRMSMLSDADQKEIKEKLKKEAFRRLNLFSYDDTDKEDLIQEENTKETKISVIKRNIDLEKKVVFSTAPQKICDIGKSLLNKIKNNIKKISDKTLEVGKNIQENIAYYSEKDDESLAAIDNALESFMQGFDEQNHAPKSDIHQITKNGTIVSRLKPGIVRMIKMPTEFISKISNRQEVISNQVTMTM